MLKFFFVELRMSEQVEVVLIHEDMYGSFFFVMEDS